MIFFHNRNHASYPDAMVGFVRGWNLIFKYRILYIIIRDIDTDPAIFFKNFQCDITFLRNWNFFTRMDGILQGICKEAAQICNLKTRKISSSDRNLDINSSIFCLIGVGGKNQVQCFIIAVSDHAAVVNIGTDLMYVLQSLIQFIFRNTVLQKCHMMTKVMTIDGSLLLGNR